MAAIRKGASVLPFLRSSARFLLSNWKAPRPHRLGKWSNLFYSSVASLGLGAGLCAVPFAQVESLSHDTLIRRAASLVTDSSSTFLSQTTLALIDAITEYSKAVHTLIALQKRYLDSLGKLSQAQEDSIWQVIIGQRAEVNDRQEVCRRLEVTWVSAVRMCETAAEAAYTSGADHASVTMQTNIQVALGQVEEARKLSQDADKKLTETKVMEIERVATLASSGEGGGEEEDIPDAYLRED